MINQKIMEWIWAEFQAFIELNLYSLELSVGGWVCLSVIKQMRLVLGVSQINFHMQRKQRKLYNIMSSINYHFMNYEILSTDKCPQISLVDRSMQYGL